MRKMFSEKQIEKLSREVAREEISSAIPSYEFIQLTYGEAENIDLSNYIGKCIQLISDGEHTPGEDFIYLQFDNHLIIMLDYAQSLEYGFGEYPAQDKGYVAEDGYLIFIVVNNNSANVYILDEN